MKTKIYVAPGETVEQAEEKLEKALKTKRKKKEAAGAREGYTNEHFDQFNQHLVDMHQDLVDKTVASIDNLLKHRLGES